MESSSNKNTVYNFDNLPETLKPYFKKYEEFIKSGNYYNMLLSVKTDLRKLVRRVNYEDYLEILSLTANLFAFNNEFDTSRTLLIDSLEELEKSNCSAEKIQDKIINLFATILNNYPNVFDTNQLLMTKFFVFCEAKKIDEQCIIEKEIYEIFAKICISNTNFMSAYKLALKTNRLDLIVKATEEFSKNFFPTEKDYFVARSALELLGKNKLEIAKKFVIEKLDLSENLQNNNPILNFIYFLICILENKQNNFQFGNFEALIKKYQVPLEFDSQLIKYLNLISKNFYDKQIIKEEDESQKGLNLGNLLKMFG